MSTASSPQPTRPVQVTGLPIDVVAVLAALQDQIDELTAHVAAQAVEISRLSGLVTRPDDAPSGIPRGRGDGGVRDAGTPAT